MTRTQKEKKSGKKTGLPRQAKPAKAWHISRTAWIVFDFLAGFSGCLLAFLLSPAYAKVDLAAIQHPTSLMASTVFGLLLVVSSQIFQLHLTNHQRSCIPRIFRCMGAVTLALFFLLGLFFIISFSRVGRLIVLQTFVYTSLLMLALRCIINRLNQDFKQHLTLIGTPRFFITVRKLIESRNLPFVISGMMDIRQDEPQLVVLTDPPESFEATQIREQCHRFGIGEIVLENPHKMPPSIHAEIGECLLKGVQVTSMDTFVERLWQVVPIDHIDYTWLHDLDLKMTNVFYHQGKRLMDILLSLIGSIAAFPFIAIAIILIKLQDGGPAFYTQTRMGRFGYPFKLYKLRTMIQRKNDDNIYTQQNDSRVTWVGKVLRKLRVDEIPQFWNVLRGEMSLVGPRAEWTKCTEIYEQEIPFYRFRHLVRPGITGWAQINYPYGANVEDAKNKLSYDLYYVKNLSLLFDLQIILQTIGAIMKGSR